MRAAGVTSSPKVSPETTSTQYKPSVPDDWFVDPVRLGIPGLRPAVQEDENQLSWQTDALCAQTDPEAFFPEKGGSTRDAKRICTTCDVKAQCLDYALQNDERFGIWGGLSERERRRLRRARTA
ncbi:MAG: WhiB family transcriptional regulator [Pseudolysinimonas sp.]|uniref:WhiB family transcriptional regulator n=1 Tax=Pseudolysinimonas sp. TaxID=2680009 RepID=UPI003264886E